MFALMNNRGSQVGLYSTRADAQKAADAFNARGLDVFAWVVEAPASAKPEDMPGRGVIYG